MNCLSKIMLASFSALTLVSCGSNETADSTPHIRVGTDSTRDNVLLLRMYFGEKKGACTGTLVAPNAVLTAAHCVDLFKGNGEFLQDEKMTVQFPVVENGKVVRFRDVAAKSYWHKQRDPLMVLDNDIALVRLSESVSDVKPAALATKAPGMGEKMTAVGYGTINCNFVFSQGEQHGTQRQASYSWGGPVFVTCPGDSGGPHFNAAGEVGAITSGTRLFGNVNPAVARHLRDLQEKIASWR